MESDSSWIDHALAGTTVGVFRWDIETDELIWSGSVFEILEVDAFDGRYESFQALVHPEDRARVDQDVRRTIIRGDPLSVEFRLLGNPGRWVEIRGHTLRKDGRALQLLGWMHDISPHKAAENALVQIAERISGTRGADFLWSLVEHLAVVLEADHAFVATLHGDPPSVVRSVALWSGGRRADNFEYPLAGTPCEEVLQQGACVHPQGIRGRYPCDRRLAEMEVEGYAGVPMVGRNGDLLGLLVVMWRNPIPDRRVAASALQIFGAQAGAELEHQMVEARQRWGAKLLARQKDALAELSRSSLWQTRNRTGLIQRICEIGARTLAADRVSVWLFDAETSRIELIDLYELSHDRHSSGETLPREGAEAYFAALGQNRVIAAHDVYHDSRTRELSDYLHSHGISSMLDAPIRVHGTTVGVFCCEHIGPPRRWLAEEESLSGSLADFAGLAIDLDNRRALEEQLLQKQSLESIGRLAGGIAHDFNNLLTAISGGAELAMLGLARSQDVRGLLTDILDSSRRAGELTSQLLGFARKRVIAPRVVDLNDIVRQTERILRRLIGEQVTLETKLGQALWKVCVDPGQFEQILINLAVNGRDAMPEGGRLLIETCNHRLSPDYVRRHPELRSHDHVLLAVSDTGVGIPKDVLPHIFEPFFTTKPRERGTGLGLSTCYGIVMQAGGQIYAYSEPGQGTTFKIYLPRADRPADVPTEQDLPMARPDGNETILLVEDDESVRRMTERGLQTFGYTVLTATKPSAAIELASTYGESIDLVITDVVMPEMSGRDLAVELAKRIPGVKMLFVSGYTENGVVHHGVLDAGLHFLAKPFTASVLGARVRDILDEPAG